MRKTRQQRTSALRPERRKRIGDRIVKMIAEERDGRARRLVRLLKPSGQRPKRDR
jgi:hypothetical protein